MAWLLVIGGIALMALGGVCTSKYVAAMNEGTGKIEGMRGKQTNRAPDYKKIEIYKKLQLLLYGGGFVLAAYGVLTWANMLNQYK